MRSALLLILTWSLVVCARADEPSDASKYPEVKDGAARVEYHRFTLVRYQRTVVALHILPDPQMGSAGITYRWFHLTDGTDTFFRLAPDSPPDALPNSAIRSGSGETYEGEYNLGSGQIKAGPLKIEWSQSGPNSGWLYLRKAAKGLEVYGQHFERLRDASGKLDEGNWKLIPEDQDDVSRGS
jgi:hypothetical protein